MEIDSYDPTAQVVTAAFMNQKLINIIKNYKETFRAKQPDNHLAFCENQDTLENVIYFAAIASDGRGKRHGHQRRLKKEVLLKFADNLLEKRKEIQKSKTFDDLYDIALKSANKGIGDLTIYDTAHRISRFLKLMPSKIYLHAGTAKGAKKLLAGIGGKKYLTKADFPAEFQRTDLREDEIEDILCIYKDRF